MQNIAAEKKVNGVNTKLEQVHLDNEFSFEVLPSPMIHGLHKSFIKLCMWVNVFIINLLYYKNPVKSFRSLNRLRKIRSDFRGNHSVLKYVKANHKYYFTFNAPGFPSKAFNNYVLNNIKKSDADNNEINLDTVVFAITKKCGYQCEHCFEWNVLNQPETLNRASILKIIDSFQQLGITQIQLSGGEPLNRFDDIIYILQHIKKGTEVWLYTSGYHFTQERAAILKKEGLTGITVSLDHWIPHLHNNFRGKKNAFEWAEKAVANARANDLVVCLSVCATKNFVSDDNLTEYASLAKKWGACFIQVLEPRAVGHYEGKNVALSNEQLQLLENFFINYNYKKANKKYPLIIYHGFYNRRVSCGGGGKHYVYIDTDGDVHNCPFCQHKIFSALHDDIEENIRLMTTTGCGIFKHS